MTDALTLILDDSRIATNRTALNLNESGGMITVDPPGPDWGSAAVTASLSQQGDYGNSLAAFSLPNRTVTIPLTIGGWGDSSDDSKALAETALRDLSMKVALFQREGGWLCRQRGSGEPLYADVVYAELTAIPDTWMEELGVETGYTLTLYCLPDFYGDEVALDPIAVTGFAAATLESGGVAAVIPGDYPARTRLQLTSTDTNTQLSLLHAVDTVQTGSEDTTAMSYAASGLVMATAASATNAAAYGGHVAQATLSTANTWQELVSVALPGQALTHQGTFRVVVRAMSSNDQPQLRLRWSIGGSAAITVNAPVVLPAENEMCAVDLGVIRIDTQPLGQPTWFGVIDGLSGSSSKNIQLDTVFLIPLDQAAGSLSAITVVDPPTVFTVNEGPTAAVSLGGSGSPWAASGDDWVTVPFEGSGSNLLQLTEYNFDIPSDATNISVIVQTVGTGIVIASENVQLTTGGSAIGLPVSQPVNEATPTTNTYGAWGVIPTYTEINATTFGVLIGVVTGDAVHGEFSLTSAMITVSYTVGDILLTQDAIVFPGNTLEVRTDGAYRSSDAYTYPPASNRLGRLPRLPASGMEGVPPRVLIKPMRGQWANGAAVDNGIDAFTLTPYFRPCFLSRI